MEACAARRGVLFTPDELPGYLSILQEVVRHPEQDDSPLCPMVLAAIRQSQKFREHQTTFMPATVAMSVSKRL
jgi:hypothetical protein